MNLKHLLAAWLVLSTGCAPEEDVVEVLERVDALTGCSAAEGTPGRDGGVYYGSWTRGTAGSVSACRKLEGNQLWTGLFKPSWVDRTKRAFQYRFVTTDADGRTQPATALLLVPKTVPQRNAGKAPLIALASGTAGLADKCAPSIATRRNDSIVQDQATHYLGLGMTVVIVDYLGLGTELKLNAATDVGGADVAYLEGPSAANVVLDALKAARTIPDASFAGGTIPHDWNASVSGSSAGAHASLWAAVSAAREHLLRASIANAPPVDLEQTATSIDGSAYSLLDVYLLSGFLASTDPDTRGVLETNLFTANGTKALAAVRSQCIVEFTANVLANQFGDVRFRNLLKDWPAFQALPQWKTWLERNSLLYLGNARFVQPQGPVLVIHGAQDTTVLPGPSRRLLVDKWRASVLEPPTTLFANIPNADRAYFQVPVGDHFTVGGIETETVNPGGRYAPFEWYLDRVL